MFLVGLFLDLNSLEAELTAAALPINDPHWVRFQQLDGAMDDFVNDYLADYYHRQERDCGSNNCLSDDCHDCYYH